MEGTPRERPKIDAMPEARTFAVVLEPGDETSGYTAIVPALPGVVAEGDTIEEAVANARDAACLCVEDLMQQGLEAPQSDAGARLEYIEVPFANTS